MSSTLQEGDPLTKRDAGYWEVLLSTATLDQLTDYDALLLPMTNPGLTGPQIEMLRAYVDQGGVLWIDIAPYPGETVGMNPASGAPLPFVLDTTPGNLGVDVSHPLLNRPYFLGSNEVRSMGLAALTNFSAVSAGPSGAAANLFQRQLWDSQRLQPVAGFNAPGGQVVGVGQIGAGWQIVTTQGVSAVLSRGFNSSGISDNLNFRSQPPYRDLSYVSAAKFAVNVLNFAASVSIGAQSVSRRSNSIGADIPAPLLQDWSDSSFSPTTAPVVAQGRTVVGTATGIAVFDSSPSADLDNNGNPDDGFQDFNNASSSDSYHDRIWTHEPGVAVSAPVYVYAPNCSVARPTGTGEPMVHQVWVAGQGGEIFIYDLLYTASAVQTPVRTISLPGATNPNLIAPAPSSDVVLVSGDRTGGGPLLGLVDVRSLQFVQTPANAPYILQGASQLGQPSAAPAIGLIPINDGSGGSDVVAYVPTLPDIGRPAGLASVWIGARGEAPVSVSRSGTTLTIRSRAALSGAPISLANGLNSPATGFRLTVMDANGQVFTPATMNARFSGSPAPTANAGEFTVTISNTAGMDFDGTTTPNDPSDDLAYRLDYLLDWSTAFTGLVPGNNFVRGSLEFPDDATPNRRVLGSPAISSKGHVMVNTAEPTGSGGTFFNLREVGRGDFDLVTRWDLFDSHSFFLNQGSTLTDRVSYRGTLNDNDGLVAELASAGFNPGRRLAGLRLVAPPTVSGDQVFLTAASIRTTIPAPGGIVISLDAHPDPVTFEVENFIESADSVPSLVQPDFAKSDNKTQLDQNSILGRSRFRAEPIVNTNRTRIILTSLMAGTRGAIRDSISTSMPVILRVSNGTDRLIEPERTTAAGRLLPGFAVGRYSPVNWYTVLLGFTAQTPVSVAGRTMYVGGNSVLPGLISAGFSAGIRQDGFIMGLDRDVSGNDPNMTSDDADTTLAEEDRRSWQPQLSLIRKVGAGGPFQNIAAPEAFRWPQLDGVTSLEDVRIRLLQASLIDEQVRAMSVGERGLTVSASQSVRNFKASEFLVLDEGRAMRVDAAGNALWSLTRTLNSGGLAASVNPSQTVPFSEPVSVAPETSGQAWIADRRANRVVLVDAYGVEQRAISSFVRHPQRPVPAMEPSAPLVLRNPSDVSAYVSYRTPAEVADAFPGETSDSAGRELWRHVVIADAGNGRAVEVIDRYRLGTADRVIAPVVFQNPVTGQPQQALGVLFWHSPAELSGPGYVYTHVERIVDPVSGASATVFGYSGGAPSSAQSGLDSPNSALGSSQLSGQNSGAGGLLIYGDGIQDTLTTVATPAFAAGSFLQTVPGGYDFVSTAEPAVAQKRINGLSSITGRWRNLRYPSGDQLELHLMIADRDGIYEISLIPAMNRIGAQSTLWMLPARSYLGLRRPLSAGPYSPAEVGGNPLGFQPTYARRLENGDVLLVNGYVGRKINGEPTTGEVMVIEGRINTDSTIGRLGFTLGAPNVGFSPLSIKYLLPPIQGARGLMRPTFAEKL
jgi:hypothetical protein